MFWISEVPIIIGNNRNLSILNKPIYWNRFIINSYVQYSIYKNSISIYNNFYAIKLFTIYDFKLKTNELIKISRTRLIKNPKLIVLYCHSIFGSYQEFSHIANEFRYDSIIYFSYSRKGVHKNLYANDYHILGCLDTLDNVIDHIKELYPNTPIHAIGVSAGACLLIQYTALRNETKKIESCVLISPGFDFLKSINDVDPMIQKFMLYKIKMRYNQCINTNSKYSKSLIEFVRLQYNSLDCNLISLLNEDPHYLLKHINVPTLMITALDDFCFIGSITLTTSNIPNINKNITMIITKNGGHMSFIDYNCSIPWSSRVAVDYIKSKLIL